MMASAVLAASPALKGFYYGDAAAPAGHECNCSLVVIFFFVLFLWKRLHKKLVGVLRCFCRLSDSLQHICRSINYILKYFTHSFCTHLICCYGNFTYFIHKTFVFPRIFQDRDANFLKIVRFQFTNRVTICNIMDADEGSGEPPSKD